MLSAARDLPRELPVRWFLNEGLELPRELDRLRATIEEHGFVLVVLDPFYNFVGGISLKDEDAAIIVTRIKREICNATGCAALIVDHAPWPTEGNRGQRRGYGSVFKAAVARALIYLERDRSGRKLYVSASGNNIRGIPRTPAYWDGAAGELRLIDTDAVAKDHAEARAWVVDYVERKHAEGASPPRGQVEEAYADAHNGEGRNRARKVITAELEAYDDWLERTVDPLAGPPSDWREGGENLPILARGTGEKAHGVYLIPFSHALSPLAATPSGDTGENPSGATNGEPSRHLAVSPKGDERVGEMGRGGEFDFGELHLSEDEIERLAALAREHAAGDEAGEGVVDRLLTSRELAEVLGFSAAWVQDRFEVGDLPGFRIGGRLRFRLSEIELWLETKRPDAEEKRRPPLERPAGA